MIWKTRKKKKNRNSPNLVRTFEFDEQFPPRRVGKGREGKRLRRGEV